MSPHSTTDDPVNPLAGGFPSAGTLPEAGSRATGDAIPTLKSGGESSAQTSALDPAAQWPETILTPHSSVWGWNLTELWRYRELGVLLAWRDIVVHYKPTLLGIAWAVLRPSLLTAIFALFLGRMVGSGVAGVPYTLFVFTALLPWTLFSTAVSAAANSVIGSERLITKVYFPRLLIPLAAIGPALVDFCFGSLLFFGLLAWYGVAPAWNSLLAILPIGVALLCAAALGAMLAAMNVVYRDIRHALPFLIQAWMFATPAIYMPVDAPLSPKEVVVIVETQNTAAELAAGEATSGNIASVQPTRTAPVPKAWLVCNPLNACVSFFRAALLGGVLPWSDLAIATLWGLVASIVGGLVFHRLESTFADVV
jgi:lipopolysaccharide transport system permease protein